MTWNEDDLVQFACSAIAAAAREFDVEMRYAALKPMRRILEPLSRLARCSGSNPLAAANQPSREQIKRLVCYKSLHSSSIAGSEQRIELPIAL